MSRRLRYELSAKAQRQPNVVVFGLGWFVDSGVSFLHFLGWLFFLKEHPLKGNLPYFLARGGGGGRFLVCYVPLLVLKVESITGGSMCLFFPGGVFANGGAGPGPRNQPYAFPQLPNAYPFVEESAFGEP